jgi:lipopolysaccharide/colanic/teichoic acid biosynthesis glycosyltransferase
MSARSIEAGSLAGPAVGATRSGSALTAAACRALDIAVAGILLLLLAPVFAAIAIAIRLDSAGWVVFRQQRLGRDLRSFTINKFRTMSAGVEEETHRAFVVALINGEEPRQGDEDAPMFKMTADARVTHVGAFLRRSSLDELPQLWNVLRGDMSLVGPRPPIAYEVEHYPPHWFARFAVKPGLTGLWQVSGRSELTLEQMIELDVDYVRRRSLWLNVQILARTIPVVLFARGAA